MSKEHLNIGANAEAQTGDSGPESDARRTLALYYELNESIRRNNPHRALELARRSLDIATRNSDRLWMARSMMQIGHCCDILGTVDAALRNFTEAEKMFRDCGSQRDQAGAAQSIGIIHKKRGNYDKALEWYARSLEVRRALNDQRGISKLDVSIGNLLRQTGRVDEALERFLAGLKISEDLKDVYGQILALHSIGNVYFTLEEYQQALEYYERSLELNNGQTDRQTEATTLCNIGYAYFELGDGESALHYLSRGLDLARVLSDHRCILSILSVQAEIDAQRGRTEEARVAAEESLRLARIHADEMTIAQLEHLLGDIALQEGRMEDAHAHLSTSIGMAERLSHAELRSRAHLSFSRYHERLGEMSQALTHHKRYASLREVVRDQSLRVATQRLQSRYDLEHERKEKEIYRLRNVELNRALHELNYANEKLQKVDRERNNLIDVVAHDMKNPLSNILLQVRQMLRFGEASQELIEFTRDVEFTVRQMLDFVDELLTASRLESDRVTINEETFDITILLRQLVTGFSDKLENKRMRLNLNMPEDECVVNTDRRGLIQVVDNLISNAIKYSPPGSLVRVRLNRMPGRFLLSVEDKGPGVRPADRDRLYRKFGRLSNRPTAGESSTGVGLWIVKLLLDRMGGTIKYRDAEGGGALFTVSLPVHGALHDDGAVQISQEH